DVRMPLTQARSYYTQGSEGEDKGRRLVYPEDDSAAGVYKRVLQLDPSNTEATEGLQNIADWYAERAQALCDRQLWTVCLTTVNEGMVARPDDPVLVRLREEAEKARLGG